MEGYPESIKFLHKNPAWNHRAPILSDIIYVKEEFRVRTRRESVLEPYLNYYVVNNLQEGLQAVHLLDANKKGKANFFLLDKIAAQPVAAGHSGEGMIPAMTVIEVDSAYRGLAEHLLGNVFIAENEEALENSNGAVVLEKTGKYVKGKYSITGGSVGLFEGKKIGRAKNLEKLTEEVTAREAVVSKLKAAIQARHNEVISYNEQLKERAIRQTQEDINRLTNFVFSLQNKVENLHAQQHSSRSRLEELQLNLEETIGGIEDTRREWVELVKVVAALKERARLAEEEYRAAEAAYNNSSAGFNEFNLQVTRQHSRINAGKQELEFKSNQLNDLRNQIEVNASQLKQTHESIAESEELLGNAEGVLVELLRKKDEEERKLNEADQSYYNLRNALGERESALRHTVKEKEQVEHLLSEIKDRLNELKLQLAGMKERLNVEFRINLDDIIDPAVRDKCPWRSCRRKPIK